MRVCGTCQERLKSASLASRECSWLVIDITAAMMQAELAGKAQDLFRLARDGKHDRQRVAGHIVGYGKIGVVNMVAEFTDVGEEACAIFRQRAGGAGADKNNTFGGENNIDGLLE